MTKLLIAIPGRSIPPYLMGQLMQLQGRGIPNHKLDVMFVGKGSIQMARDELAKVTLEKGFDRVLFIDTDLKITYDNIIRILSHDVDIVAGLYARKVVDAFWEIAVSKQVEPVNGLIPIEGAGGGFVAIKANVFKVMKDTQPQHSSVEGGGRDYHNWFFQGTVHCEKYPQGRFMGEDHGFFYWAQRAGFTPYADVSFFIPHTGEADYPLQDVYGLSKANIVPVPAVENVKPIVG